MLVLKAFWFFALLHKGNSDCSKLGYCANTYCHLTFNKMNCSMWSKQTRGNKSGWYSGRQGSPNRWRRRCYKGWDRLASRPYKQRSERPETHYNLVWWHSPQWRMGLDSSALHRRVGWECCLMHYIDHSHLMLQHCNVSGKQVFGQCWDCGIEDKKMILILPFKWLSE